MAHRLNIIIHFWSGADQGGGLWVQAPSWPFKGGPPGP